MPSQSSLPALRRFWMLVVLALFTIGGCGKNEIAVADQDQAKKLLDETLTSWKKGETVDALKSASPSILVEDPKWKRGAKLSKFEIEDDGKPSGAERAFTVSLWLADSKGKEVREQVVYKVGTNPILTVFRALF